MGRLYGRKMSLALSYDTAFLAELLDALSQKEENRLVSRKDTVFSFSNCLVLPPKNKEGDIGLPFLAAGAVNIILAQLTLRDKIEDAGKWKAFPWKWAAKTMSKQYKQAAVAMNRWRFPLQEIEKLAAQQKHRENEFTQNAHHSLNTNAEEALNYFSKTTAIITGKVFQHSARLVGKESEMRKMYSLGNRFGKLVYLLDALEDFEKDRKQGAFNAIAAAYGLTAPKLNEIDRLRVTGIIFDLQKSLDKALKSLALPVNKKETFCRRLKVNLESRLDTEGGKCDHSTFSSTRSHTACKTPKIGQSAAEIWQYARQKSKRL
ncbi:MAG: hypothetical protein GY757_48285, partial [bacterium]|nr:hypothetical protein [bacterium]